MLVIVLLDGSRFNLNAHRSETEQNSAAAQSLMLIHIVHSGFELFISRFPTVKYFIISKQPVGYLGLFDKRLEQLVVFMHDKKNSPSLIPSPRPAFHHLQYRKGMESWAGPGNEAKSANTVSKKHYALETVLITSS